MPEGCDHIRSLDRQGAKDRVESLVKKLTKAGNAPEEAKAVLEHLEKSTTTNQDYFEIKYGFGDLVVDKGFFKLPGVSGQPGFPSGVKPCPYCTDFQSRFNKTVSKVPVPLLLNLGKNLEVFRIFTDVHFDKDPSTKKPRSRIGYRMVPINYRRPGEVIGLFEKLRSLVQRPAYYGPFYVSAGARNCHLVLPLERTSSLLADLKHRHTNIRNLSQEMDATEYGIDYQSVLSGIASDWRVIRDAVGSTEWEASLLLLPDNFLNSSQPSAPSVEEKSPKLLQTFFRAGFEQLQDALSAFTQPESGDHHLDTAIFMNVEKPSVPAMLNHLKASIEGERFVHAVAAEQDDNGPWPALFRKLNELKEAEVSKLRYLPLLLEPRKLAKSFPGPAIVSFVHPLTPTGLYVTHRPNDRWIVNTDFPERMKIHGFRGYAEIYPLTDKEMEEAGELELVNPACWPVVPRSTLLGENPGKLCRKTCLSQFMTVRYRRKAAARAADSTK